MFVPTIKGAGTDEQQQKWLPLAYKMQMIGCYAQTELGHGSNVQGLETTATFDLASNEFVIHNPTLTSNKRGKNPPVTLIPKFANGESVIGGKISRYRGRGRALKAAGRESQQRPHSRAVQNAPPRQRMLGAEVRVDCAPDGTTAR
ncbi:acyl-coenzyme A oxidase [Stylosanthes scabra]|uniref:Acyl-coenzyme A oxidase n=1 Tax=Stylosanthes scabra TaxID=79078 RepID=A0ABU6TJP9_9FABA|nr:acyl-coenzyme A oxidase [Stylosanthes scabra]